jgi:hypothetical protein
MARPEYNLEGDRNIPAIIVDRIVQKLLPWHSVTWVYISSDISMERPWEEHVWIDIFGMVVEITADWHIVPTKEGAIIYHDYTYKVKVQDVWDNEQPDHSRQYIERVLNGWIRDDNGNLHPPKDSK